MKKLALTFILFSLVLVGCTTLPPIQTTSHSQEVINDINKFVPSKNSGRVYFLNGNVTGPAYSGDVIHSFPSALMIDGIIVGKKNKLDVMVLDVKPGKYDVMWNHAYAEDTTKTKPIIINIVKGDIVILRANYNLGGGGIGLISALLASPSYELVYTRDISGINGLNFVKASSCPDTICDN